MAYNQAVLYKETEILVRRNRRKKLKRYKMINKEKQLCGNDPVEFQLCYCPYVFKHIFPCYRKKVIGLAWCLSNLILVIKLDGSIYIAIYLNFFYVKISKNEYL